jgi:hypothetical protein
MTKFRVTATLQICYVGCEEKKQDALLRLPAFPVELGEPWLRRRPIDHSSRDDNRVHASRRAASLAK